MGAMFVGQQFLQNVLDYSTLEAGAAILPAAVCMVLIAPRSAKLVEARGARFTLLVGYVFCLLGFLTMLLLWKEDISYWKVGARLRPRRHRRRLRRHSRLALADGLRAGAPGRDGIGNGRPAARPRWSDHAVDLRRAADGRLRGGGGDGDRRSRARTISDSVQSQLTKSFAGAEAIAEQYPQYAAQITAGREDVLPAGRSVGLHGRDRRDRCRRGARVLPLPEARAGGGIAAALPRGGRAGRYGGEPAESGTSVITSSPP